MLEQRDLEMIGKLIRKELDGTKQDIGGMKQDIGGMKQDIGGMKQDIGGMKQEIGGMKQDIEGMKQDIGGMKQEIGGMKQDIGGMKQDIEGMKQDIGGMKQDIKELKENQEGFDRELKAINVTLENEVIKSIKIIAEGHMDLSRKLDEALKFKKEREMTNLQLVQMQGEITRLKIKVNGQQ